MAAPTFVAAGAGVACLTGTSTVSKTTCTANNLLLFHVLVRGAGTDWSEGNGSNVKKQDGTTNSYSEVAHNSPVGVGASKHSLFIARVTANGTCSFDVTVGASGDDIFARIYEFAGVLNSGANQGAGTIENGASTYDSAAVDARTTIPDVAVTTTNTERLACNLVAISTNQNIPAFTGSSGGNWAEAEEFNSASGATGSLQLQTATMASAGTIDNGSCTVTSTDYGIFGLALIPASPGARGRVRVTTGSRW